MISVNVVCIYSPRCFEFSMFYNQIIQSSDVSGYNATLNGITMDLCLLKLSSFDL